MELECIRLAPQGLLKGPLRLFVVFQIVIDDFKRVEDRHRDRVQGFRILEPWQCLGKAFYSDQALGQFGHPIDGFRILLQDALARIQRLFQLLGLPQDKAEFEAGV